MQSTQYIQLDVVDSFALWLAEYADGHYSDDTYMVAFAGKYADAFGHYESEDS